MSQNPFKAQFQANKALNKPAFMNKNESGQQPGQAEQSTVPAFKPPTAPQWKPNQNATSGPPTSFQPPGFKPPVANQTNPPTASTTSVPFQPSGGFKPPGSNPTTTTPGSTPFQPPGFKPPGTNPQAPGGFGGWKNKPSPMGTERQKQQQEARIKKEKQQEQKKKKLKQQQIIRQARQIKRMQYQDEYSKIRQQQDKRKKPTKSVKKILKSPDKKSGIKSYKKLPPLTKSFYRYLFNLNLACSKQQEYSDKIQNQKQFVNSIYKFTEQLKQGLIGYLKQRKISQRKKNVINLQNMVVQYALVEGITGQPGSAYFKTKNIQNLQLKYCYYQVMFNLIAKLIKKSTVFRIRVPLLGRFSFKGIEFLGQGVCQELLQAVPAPAQNFIQLHGELTQLEKELREAGYQFLNRKMFLLKKITFNNQQVYILYISQPLQSSMTSKQLQQNSRLLFYPYNIPTFDNLINLSLINSHKINLTYTFMRNFNEQFKKNTTQKMKEAYLNLFPLAHSIRIVYASCQGELDDQSFWYLVWDENTQIWGMVKRAFQGIYGDFKNQKQQYLRNKFMLAKIVEVMVPVKFGVARERTQNQSPYKGGQNLGRKKPKFISNSFLMYPYPLESFQLYEISNFFDKTIQNPGKIKIAEDSHKLQQSFLQKSQQLYLNPITVLTNKSLLLFKKGLFANNPQLIKQAIQIIENYEFSKGQQMQKIIIYPLLIKLYMEAIQADFEANSIFIKEQQNKQQKQQTDQDQNRQKEQMRLDQSQVRQIQNAQQIKIDRQKQKDKDKQITKKKGTSKIFRKQQDYETRILKIFQLLLGYIQQLFQNQKQIWMHGGLYLILASYYSKPKKPKQFVPQNSIKLQRQNNSPINQQKNLSYFNKQSSLKTRTLSKSHSNTHSSPSQLRQNLKNTQSVVQQLEIQDNQDSSTYQHPYQKQCMKFIQLGHNICMQYYGAYSIHMAQFMLHESDIYYNIHQYKKAQTSIIQSLKIYKSSSKHSRQILTCSTILGKSLLQLGKQEKNNKTIERGIEILEKTVEDLVNLGMDGQAMAVYEFLCVEIQVENKNGRKTQGKNGKIEAITQNDGNIRYAKVEQYLQKMAEMAFLSKNIQSLKKVITKIIKNELPFYSKQRSIALKDSYDRYVKQNNIEEEDQHEQIIRLQQNMTFLEQQKSNYGGLLEVIKWAFGILKSKSESIEFEKANQIMRNILGFFNERQLLHILCL